MGKIYAAKTNHITNPIGFNMDTIAFSWKVKGCRGQNQKHARIVISKNKTFTDICYDTGETELDSLSTRVEFEIQPYTRYYWKVIVTTDAEEVIESDTQFYSFLRLPKWMNHGLEDGLLVTAVRNVIRFFQKGLNRKKK